ncbi:MULTISPECIES: MFS transporter [unclassified Sphingomonas]|uniref:MFS transporter n=1 Tax=unclassified Sphingomonas TaxID=196159 RepID=UPI00215178CE|nr:MULTISPECIES: glycoside-pentoside-hexuronide (GPH):cation symporter [unclassified Sphingomonas]MCR5870572.1 glycoside-pentoside-hexuronide (GPH):cation symporter [Sphingomonas sp. J344]UUY01084.1 glycoside-pentoside-hexuronide (GPH):cation symporter [Sphingomonas sp. J315]
MFGFGDFAFNLYWQSAMLFLLFYYTDALGLPVGVAATIFLAASVWDGIANFAAGLLADRHEPRGGLGRLLALGGMPLGLGFMLAYLPPLAPGYWGMAGIFAGHILFRTAYAFLNVPYLAMSARVSTDSNDRAFVAGVRMLSGTLAAIVVALGTVPLGAGLLGAERAADAYFGAAILFALAGAAILAFVGLSYREADVPQRAEPVPVLTALRAIAANRAFVTLNLAMMAVIVAVTILNKSVLYYFKYFLHDEASGQLALASMSVVSAVSVPLWMLLRRRIGARGLWFLAAGLASAGLAAFALVDIHRAGVMQAYLMAMQAMIVGLNFVFWAMLPNTIEYGEQRTGLRVEGAVFGMAALLQRVAIGLATAILGFGFDSAGYVANVDQSDATLTAMRLTIALVPLGFLAFSCVMMALNPLARGTHAQIVRDLRG